MSLTSNSADSVSLRAAGIAPAEPTYRSADSAVAPSTTTERLIADRDEARPLEDSTADPLASEDDLLAELLERELAASPTTTAATIPALGLRRTTRPRDALDSNELDDHEFGLTGQAAPDNLGVAGIETLDLEGETVRLYRQVRLLLSRVLVDKGVPANQKASVANGLSNQLKALVNLQTDIYNAERLKRLETVIIRMVKAMPDDISEQFLIDYEREVNVR